MISKDILKKVKKIEIRTRKIVNNIFSGEYHSVFKGRGMEFDEVREYTFGDEIRTIDWNVTARMNKPYIKKFVEERELTVMILFDASKSGNFGTSKQLKSEIGIEISSLLAFSAIKNNDKVGLIIFTDKIEKYIPPKKGKKHVLRVIRELLSFEPEDNATNINCALEYLNKVIKRKATVFLVSDFLNKNYEKALQIANKKHDLVSIVLKDEKEEKLPNLGFIEFEDAETGEQILIDTYSNEVRDLFFKSASIDNLNREKMFRKLKVDHIDILTNKSYVKPLINFFNERSKRS
jgi:uncharacterized protein (DUF58 family)